MIYLNFFYLIVAISLYIYAPDKKSTHGHPLVDLALTVSLLIAFWYFSKLKFTRLRKKYDEEEISSELLKKECVKYINLFILFSLLLFGVELFSFNLKYFFNLIPGVKGFETLGEVLGISFFILHLIIVWYWAARIFGDIFPSF